MKHIQRFVFFQIYFENDFRDNVNGIFYKKISNTSVNISNNIIVNKVDIDRFQSINDVNSSFGLFESIPIELIGLYNKQYVIKNNDNYDFKNFQQTTFDIRKYCEYKKIQQYKTYFNSHDTDIPFIKYLL